MKTLILYSDNDSYYFSKVNSENIVLRRTFKSKNWLQNKFLKIFRERKSFMTKFFYGDWYKNLEEYDKVIVFDIPFNYDKRLLDNINEKFKGKKYFYSWNVVINEEAFYRQKNAADSAGFRFYSYDKGDCEKYGLNFNTIMYEKSVKLPDLEPEYDTFFLGYLKDRKLKMKQLYDTFVKMNFEAKFVIVSRAGENRDMPFDYRDKHVGYFEYLEMVNKSRTILDINQNQQDGYSLRVMESIFLNKKLITTNKAVAQADFYNSNNILIIDLENINEEAIADFFKKPFVEYPPEVKEYYSVEGWVSRFN